MTAIQVGFHHFELWLLGQEKELVYKMDGQSWLPDRGELNIIDEVATEFDGSHFDESTNASSACWLWRASRLIRGCRLIWQLWEAERRMDPVRGVIILSWLYFAMVAVQTAGLCAARAGR